MSDLISRQEVSDIIKTRLYQTALNNTEYITSYDKVCEDIAENRIDTWINEAKSVEPERKPGKCKECKYFEYDSVAKVNGMSLIVAHEICKRWGDGCKTKEDGYCFLYEPQESEEV